MTIKIKTWIVVLAILGAFTGTFFVGKYIGQKKTNRALESIIDSQSGIIKTYEYKIGELTKIAYEKEQVIATQKEIIRKGVISKEELRVLHLKSLTEITALRGKIEILQDSINHSGVVVDTSEYIGETFVILPFEFRDSTKYYDIWGDMDTTGMMSFGLDVPVELSVWSGKDQDIRGNYKVIVTSLNPFVKIMEIKSYKFDVPRPKKWGIGIVGGYGMNPENLGEFFPYIGIGLSYSFIRW